MINLDDSVLFDTSVDEIYQLFAEIQIFRFFTMGSMKCLDLENFLNLLDLQFSMHIVEIQPETSKSFMLVICVHI